jgi:hypothetical protein
MNREEQRVYYAAQTRRIHRKRAMRKLWFKVRYPFMRPLCLLRRHDHWQRETMLLAMAGGRSVRCHTCNRLILKAQYRDDAGWLRTTRGWIWSKG